MDYCKIKRSNRRILNNRDGITLDWSSVKNDAVENDAPIVLIGQKYNFIHDYD